VNSPRSNDIDWKVAALNGLGLILFFVPGVVAFAVDFYTGAIYLPAGSVPGDYAANNVELTRRDIALEQIDMMAIEEAVSGHVGKSVSLRGSGPRVSELASIESYSVQLERHQRDTRFGHTLQSFFSPWKNRLGIEA
jgi:hypothetical protein